MWFWSNIWYNTWKIKIGKNLQSSNIFINSNYVRKLLFLSDLMSFIWISHLGFWDEMQQRIVRIEKYVCGLEL